MSAEAKLAQIEYARQQQLEAAQELVLEIMLVTDEAVEVSKTLVLQVLGNFAGEHKPNYEQVRAALLEQNITVVEAAVIVTDAVLEICLPELLEAAAQKVMSILNEAARNGAETTLVAFKANIQQIKKAIKSVKPSGKMLDAQLIYNQMAVSFPALANNTAAQAFFVKTFKD